MVVWVVGLADALPARFGGQLRADRDRVPARRIGHTADDEVEYLGFEQGYAGQSANPPTGLSFPTLVRYFEGYLAGQAEFEVEMLEFHHWLDQVNAQNPDDRFEPAELAEAGMASGHPSFEA